MSKQNFTVAGRGERSIELTAGIIAGWTGRDASGVQHHIDELAAIGVAPPSTVPLFYRVSASLFTTDTILETVGATSSGEAEPVLVDDGTELFLGLGSDHTDRELEAHSVALSKQVCGKPMAAELWALSEVADHLDDIVIRSFVRDTNDADWSPYQEGTLARIRPLAELVERAPLGQAPGRLVPGATMMCGTFPVLSGGVRPAGQFRMEMEDVTLGRRIAHTYEMRTLPVVA